MRKEMTRRQHQLNLGLALVISLSTAGCFLVGGQTLSPRCRAAVDECLRDCPPGQMRQPRQASQGQSWWDPPDERNACERACHRLCEN